MPTGNSPKKTMSRLMHSDYFENLSKHQLRDFLPKIAEHMEKCQHPKCVTLQQNSN